MIQNDSMNDSTVVVRPHGTISITNADALRGELLEAIGRGPERLVIDLAEVDMIDSTGLALFVQCHQSMSERNGRLEVIAEQEQLRGLFRVMRLDEHFVIRSSRDAA